MRRFLPILGLLALLQPFCTHAAFNAGGQPHAEHLSSLAAKPHIRHFAVVAVETPQGYQLFLLELHAGDPHLPEWGSFTGPDMLIDVHEANGACNYLFANNNPLVYVDPTGLRPHGDPSGDLVQVEGKHYMVNSKGNVWQQVKTRWGGQTWRWVHDKQVQLRTKAINARAVAVAPGDVAILKKGSRTITTAIDGDGIVRGLRQQGTLLRWYRLPQNGPMANAAKAAMKDAHAAALWHATKSQLGSGPSVAQVQAAYRNRTAAVFATGTENARVNVRSAAGSGVGLAADIVSLKMSTDAYANMLYDDSPTMTDIAMTTNSQVANTGTLFSSGLALAGNQVAKKVVVPVAVYTAVTSDGPGIYLAGEAGVNLITDSVRATNMINGIYNAKHAEYQKTKLWELIGRDLDPLVWMAYDLNPPDRQTIFVP